MLLFICPQNNGHQPNPKDFIMNSTTQLNAVITAVQAAIELANACEHISASDRIALGGVIQHAERKLAGLARQALSPDQRKLIALERREAKKTTVALAAVDQDETLEEEASEAAWAEAETLTNSVDMDDDEPVVSVSEVASAFIIEEVTARKPFVLGGVDAVETV
jgi:hypothetical protein